MSIFHFVERRCSFIADKNVVTTQFKFISFENCVKESLMKMSSIPGQSIWIYSGHSGLVKGSSVSTAFSPVNIILPKVHSNILFIYVRRHVITESYVFKWTISLSLLAKPPNVAVEWTELLYFLNQEVASVLNYALSDEDVRTHEGRAPSILSALDGCEQSASSSWCFAPCGRAFYLLAEVGGAEAAVDDVKKGKFFTSIANRTSYYTD